MAFRQSHPAAAAEAEAETEAEAGEAEVVEPEAEGPKAEEPEVADEAAEAEVPEAEVAESAAGEPEAEEDAVKRKRGVHEHTAVRDHVGEGLRNGGKRLRLAFRWRSLREQDREDQEKRREGEERTFHANIPFGMLGTGS